MKKKGWLTVGFAIGLLAFLWGTTLYLWFAPIPAESPIANHPWIKFTVLVLLTVFEVVVTFYTFRGTHNADEGK